MKFNYLALLVIPAVMSACGHNPDASTALEVVGAVASISLHATGAAAVATPYCYANPSVVTVGQGTMVYCQAILASTSHIVRMINSVGIPVASTSVNTTSDARGNLNAGLGIAQSVNAVGKYTIQIWQVKGPMTLVQSIAYTVNPVPVPTPAPKVVAPAPSVPVQQKTGMNLTPGN